MKTLSSRICETCGKDARALDDKTLEDCLKELPGWQVVHGHGSRWLEKVFVIKPYTAALAFIQKVGELAEHENHHPELLLEWGKVTVKWYTHTIQNIHINDCILAARCDELCA